MTCTNCSALLVPGSAFCTNCGTRAEATGSIPLVENSAGFQAIPENPVTLPPPPGAFAQNQPPAAVPPYQVPPAPQQYAGQPYAGQPYAGQPQGYAPQQYAPPPAPSPLGAELSATLRGFFSKDIVDSTARTIDAKSPLWAIFAGAYVLLAALVGAFVPSALISNATAGFGGGIWPSGPIFLVLFFAMAAWFFIWVTGVFILYRAHHAPVSYLQVLNLTSAAFLPSVLGIAGGGILSLLWPPLGMLALGAGIIASIVLIYQAVQRTQRFAGGMFWSFIAVYTGAAICGGIIAAIITNSLMNDLISSILRF